MICTYLWFADEKDCFVLKSIAKYLHLGTGIKLLLTSEKLHYFEATIFIIPCIDHRCRCVVRIIFFWSKFCCNRRIRRIPCLFLKTLSRNIVWNIVTWIENKMLRLEIKSIGALNFTKVQMFYDCKIDCRLEIINS